MTLFDFKKLPIYEIGLSIEFEPMFISSAYIGLYWQTIKEQFSETEDIEGSFSEEGSFLQTTIQGVRFINPQKSTYIQIENCRFDYIFRKNTEKNALTMESLINDFCYYFHHFQDWLLTITGEENLRIKCCRFLLKYLLDEQLTGVNSQDHNQLFKNQIDVTHLEIEKLMSYEFDLITLLPNTLGVSRIFTEKAINIEDQSEVLFLHFINIIQDLDADDFDVKNWFNQVYVHNLKSLSALTTEQLQQQWR